MKRYSMILAVAMVAVSMVAPAMAQEAGFPDFYTYDHYMRSSKMIGMPVYNDHGEKIGVINDIMLPAGGGEVAATLSVGEFTGTGAKMVKIPLSHLLFSGKKPMMTGDGSKSAVMAMPAYSYNGGLATPG
jgi:hypothetical protein